MYVARALLKWPKRNSTDTAAAVFIHAFRAPLVHLMATTDGVSPATLVVVLLPSSNRNPLLNGYCASLLPSQKINQFEVFIPLSVITRPASRRGGKAERKKVAPVMSRLVVVGVGLGSEETALEGFGSSGGREGGSGLVSSVLLPQNDTNCPNA